MVKLYDSGVYLLNGTEIVEDHQDAAAVLHSRLGDHVPTKEEAKKNTIAYRILKAVSYTHLDVYKRQI